MEEISAQDLFEQVRDSVGRCSSAVLGKSDEDLSCDLFEEFEVGAWSLLHKDTMARLARARLVDEEIVRLSDPIQGERVSQERNQVQPASLDEPYKARHPLFSPGT